VALPLIDALTTLRDARGERIVGTTTGAAREWPNLSDHPLDLHYIPSSMGQAPALGLGLALAQPQREVVVLNGDGCMLMNLGSLVTIATAGAANLTLVVMNNGIYEVTGGQRTAGGTGVEFASLAAAAGFAGIARYETLEEWNAGVDRALTLPGPRFIELVVEPVGADYLLEVPGPMAERLAAFRRALAEG